MPEDAQILNEIVRLLGSIPEKATFRHDNSVNHEWLGSVLFIVGKSGDISLAAEARTIISGLQGPQVATRDPRARLVILLQQLKREYEFKLGYYIPRNYVEMTDEQLEVLSAAKEDLKSSVNSDNELSEDDRTIALHEIAMFEASLGAGRFSSDLISRFVNGFLKGAIILSGGVMLKQAASRMADEILNAMGWAAS
ncbi:hypothetical protein HY29_09710 [Hyphomonas beringensis]|uniref:Uncharacterized protein n=1 Tax=Hyphomonas beringensis TaxID=1280946 RepID=A0A062U697_9PROT|nr:hypothetical protein [Hyphomonas beringensis]KCZ55871.1 hypothetical protein HY29_09710 [Hyphomonas beringensis]